MREKNRLENASIRFWKKVQKTSTCWIWVGPKQQKGYGLFYVLPESESSPMSAHRWVFQFFYGPLPPSVLVCHICDNPSCVNPVHLFAGTYRDNNRDTVRKGRHRSPQKEKTICKNGHQFIGDNILWRNNKTRRVCRECKRVNSSKRYHKQRLINLSKRV